MKYRVRMTGKGRARSMWRGGLPWGDDWRDIPENHPAEKVTLILDEPRLEYKVVGEPDDKSGADEETVAGEPDDKSGAIKARSKRSSNK